MFGSLIDSSPVQTKKRIGRVFASSGSVAVHGSILLGLLFASYFQVEPLAEPRLKIPVVFPGVEAPSAAAAAPPPPAGHRASSVRSARQLDTAPRQIPADPEHPLVQSPPVEEEDPGEQGADEGMEGGVDGGVPGGKPGGRPGGIPGGSEDGLLGGFPGGALHGLPGQDQPLHLIGDVRPPERITFVKPEYPETARKARVEGKVILEIVVGRSGDVESVKVLRSNPLFDQAAIEAVQRWKYQPAVQGGRPVKVYLTVIVDFQLK